MSHRHSGHEKTIIGVPVLPGFAPVASSMVIDVDDSSSDIASTGTDCLSCLLSYLLLRRDHCCLIFKIQDLTQFC